MAFVSLDFPPGLYRAGTERQSRGRWYDANLVRFYEGTIKPVGGWRTKTAAALTGAARAIISWKTKNLTGYAAIGTHSHLYTMDESGTLYDITPTGFTAGNSDAIAGGGFGSGAFGQNAFGVPGSDSSSVQDCTVWSLDTFGEDLLGCTADDGKLYEWTLATNTPAALISGAPTGCRALIVTAERFLVALGAGGDPRNVQWADQQSLTSWTPTTTNQAGSFPLQSPGKLMLGRRVQGGTLLLTDLDAWLMTNVGGLYIFDIQKLADGCGAPSQTACADFDGNAVWMGRNNFFFYTGIIRPLPCDVQDYVFSNINFQQSSKITCCLDTQHGEVTWYYPSAASIENDSYVTWSYRSWERGQSIWMYGSLARMSGADRGTFQYSLRVGADGYVYEHEVGFAYQDRVGSPQVPYLESGPVELGAGDYVMSVQQVIPDEKNQGDVNLTFKAKFYPNATEYDYGPYSITEPTSVRFQGRQVKMHFTAVNDDDWRIGSFRLDVRQAGMR